MTPRPADALAEAHLAPLVSLGEVPSLAWAVVRDEDTAVGGFGGAGPATIYQVGSVTKVFTALLLADMAERGEVHLSDPAASYLPGPAPPGLVALAAPAALASAIPATFTPRRSIPGGEIALAWHHARRGDGTIAWHNGMTGGFSAMVALHLARGLGVAALANTAGAPPSPLDRAVLSAFES
jgi:CubicO group peptidase (beta-lactamase class C family)